MRKFIRAIANLVGRILVLFIIEIGVFFMVRSSGGYGPSNGFAVVAAGINLVLLLMFLRAVLLFFRELFGSK